MSKLNHTKRNDHASLLYAVLASFFFFALVFITTSLSGGGASKDFAAVKAALPKAGPAPFGTYLSIRSMDPEPNFINSTQTFSWYHPEGVTEYWVELISLVDKKKIYSKAIPKVPGPPGIPGNPIAPGPDIPGTSVTISNIPEDGRLLVFRLWFRLGNKWYYQDVGYQANQFPTRTCFGPVCPLP